jgi:hypothetical protein
LKHTMPGTHGGAQQDAGCNGKQPSAANASKAVDFLKNSKTMDYPCSYFPCTK